MVVLGMRRGRIWTQRLVTLNVDCRRHKRSRLISQYQKHKSVPRYELVLDSLAVPKLMVGQFWYLHNFQVAAGDRSGEAHSESKGSLMRGTGEGIVYKL